MDEQPPTLSYATPEKPLRSDSDGVFFWMSFLAMCFANFIIAGVIEYAEPYALQAVAHAAALLIVMAVGLVVTRIIAAIMGYSRLPRFIPIIFGIPPALVVIVEYIRWMKWAHGRP